ncbi:alpha/beta hydrolase [Spirosoma endbachense]|uniref:Prolyl oligopeptidase family serine peptidase n=1 Tax=Spirosoma endbachense TaxID=2666025 RepID=A0A6P1W7Z5_9BACT|nr:alpha/beta hydrolase [Spirosoma endbachense]QHW00031.1 prolyl oligopeptidase family serine peptidase [Spirosoma endbachense]
MRKIILLFILLLTSDFYATAQEFIPLWPMGKMPNTKGVSLKDSIANERVYRVGTPGMYAFFPSTQENKGAAVVICPGGGYERLAYVISGWQLAKWFNTMGISAFVLNYRLPNSPDLKQRELGPLQDAQRAIRFIRSNAKKWRIKPDRIGSMGSSAGGHLAALLATNTTDVSAIGDSVSRQSFRPDFAILVSPVITMGNYAHAGSRKNLLGPNPSADLLKAYSLENAVTSTTPPCFLTHAYNDTVVDQRNSLLFYQALIDQKIPASLHIFPQGGHAIALRNNPGSTQQWTTLCESWLLEMNLISDSN